MAASDSKKQKTTEKGATMYDEAYVKNHTYERDSDTLYHVLNELHMQDEPITAAQAEAMAGAAASLSKGVEICNDREDLMRNRELLDLFRFVDFAGKATPLSMCEKVMSHMQSPAELRFMSAYLRSKGLAEASKEAATRADEKTLKAPDVSFAKAGATPTHKEINEAVAQLRTCTEGLFHVYGLRDDMPAVLRTEATQSEDAGDGDWKVGQGLDYELPSDRF